MKRAITIAGLLGWITGCGTPATPVSPTTVAPADPDAPRAVAAAPSEPAPAEPTSGVVDASTHAPSEPSLPPPPSAPPPSEPSLPPPPSAPPPPGVAAVVRAIGSPSHLVVVGCALGRGDFDLRPGSRRCPPLDGGEVELAGGARIDTRGPVTVASCSLPSTEALRVIGADLPEDTLAIWPAGRSSLASVGADVNEVVLAPADRAAIGRAIKAEVVASYEPGGAAARRVAREHDAWLAAGAPLEVLQSLRIALDPDRRADRVAIVVSEPVSGTSRVFLVGSRTGQRGWDVLHGPAADPRLRITASTDLDGDGWLELVVLDHTTALDRTLWLISSRRRDDDRWPFTRGSSRCGAARSR